MIRSNYRRILHVFIPAFFFRKKGILISYQSRSVLRVSVHHVSCKVKGQIIYFLVNVSPAKP